MKALLTSSLAWLAFSALGQAPLPTSYSFENFAGQSSVPQGWTTNITGSFTYVSGQAGMAGKLDAEDEFIQIQTADAMGIVTFYLQGWIGGSATSWTGTFKVQESVNGSTWTDLASYTTLNEDNYNQYTLNPASASRYIRWIFTQKNSGANVGIDEISVAVAQVQTPEIDVVQNSTTLFNGGTSLAFGSPVGTPTVVNFTINNLSILQDLVISNATITGTASGDFSGITFPNSLASGQNGVLSFTFNPSAAGTRSATLTISSNDPDEGNFIITLYGVGGSFATEPSAPTNLVFNNVKAFRYRLNFTDASPQPDGGYLVLRKVGSAVTEVPADGTSYSKGDYIGGAQVVSVSNVNAIYPRFVVANTEYHFAVFSYNGDGNYINYNTSNALTGTVTTPNGNPGTYYASVDPLNTNFPTQLQATINPHISIFYSNYEQTMVRNFSSRDTSDGRSVVTCAYSGENKIYTGALSWTNDNFSREHCYARSWMPSLPVDNPEKPEYNDQHHLFPVNQTEVNEVRSNNPFNEVVTLTSSYLLAKYGKDANGKNVYEPRDEIKGDVARALFYVSACYNTVAGNDWSLPSASNYNQNQEILKKWHYQDPPSNYEIARNEYLDSLQENRNPFIDNPDWVCYIDFKTMQYIPNPEFPCNQVGMNDDKNTAMNQVMVFPNPSTSEASMQVEVRSSGIFTISIEDIGGRKLTETTYLLTNGLNQIPLSVAKLSKGMYVVKVSGDTVSSQLKFIKE